MGHNRVFSEATTTDLIIIAIIIIWDYSTTMTRYRDNCFW